MVLVQILVDRRDLALAERVVQRIVDLRCGDAEPRRCRAVDMQFDIETRFLAVGIDVQQFRHVLQRHR